VRFFPAGTAIIGVALLASSGFAGTVYSNDFESASTADFSGGSINTSPSGQHFLGEFGQSSATTLTLTGLAPHSTVTLGFTLDVVGSMDGVGPFIAGGGNGDFFTVDYSGNSSGNVFDHAFANYAGGNTQDYPAALSAATSGSAGTDTLGYTGFPDSGNGVQDSIYNFILSPIADSAGTISFTFTSLSNEALSNEFYGIDNVVVSTDASATPEPSTIFLGASGLCLLIARKLRAQRG
jgi:hypothetical protein